jgi:DNA-binding transcriptional regulator YiaG
MDRHAKVCHARPMTAPARHETVIPEWSIADRLRKIRRDYARMDQDAFAEALGVKPSRYGAWETGRNKPENLVALAMRVEEVTGVPAAWTLGVYGGLAQHPHRVSSVYNGQLMSSTRTLTREYVITGNCAAA